MKKFNYFAPRNIEEVISTLKETNSKYKFIAGGTDLIIQINQKKFIFDNLIDLKNIQELNYIRSEDTDVIKIGSMTTFTCIEENNYLREYVKLLTDACGEVGSTQIRNLGTIGGNVANASAAGDSLTALLALEANLILDGIYGKREILLSEFYKDPKQIQLKEGEFIVEINFKKPSSKTVSTFKKLGKRKALAIVVLSIAVKAEIINEHFQDIKIVVGASSRYPQRILEAERILMGKSIKNTKLIERCIEIISLQVKENVLNSPYKDIAAYKEEAIKGIAREALIEIINKKN